MDRYVCTICGYVYDPEQGDPDNGVKAGTKFEDLPGDWNARFAVRPKTILKKRSRFFRLCECRCPFCRTQKGHCHFFHPFVAPLS